MVPCWTHMGKAIWELYGFSMGKSTHISLPEKKKQKLLDIFIQMIRSQDKFSKCIHFVMNKLLFLFSYYHYYLHLCQKIYYFFFNILFK